MRAEIDGVLFDFAGTLFMPTDAPQWVRKAAGRLGVELGDAQAEQLAGRYLDARLSKRRTRASPRRSPPRSPARTTGSRTRTRTTS